MNNFKKITYTLLAIISFSLISASAQAGGISIRIGGFGHGYHHGHNAYYPSTYYYGYHSPLVTYRHHYRPYYGYQHNSHYGHYGFKSRHHSRHYSRHYGGHHQSYIGHKKYGTDHGSKQHHNKHDNHRSNNHHSNHVRSGIASNRNHR